MRARTAVSVGLAGLLLAGATAPALATTKKKPKPIKGTYQAQALPDPSTTGVQGTCNPLTPTAKFEKAFTVPAKGYLHLETENTLDWALAIFTEDGEELGSSDGESPEVKEMTDVTFKKKTKVILRTCNFAGEPQVTVNYTFTYK